ncbi:polyprenyl synthetase family protein [Heliophilum fasciatum]|nr:polyprenyl synthetase family protein [Heliophilum fasciatum]MCW2278455.1 geranylgeranyl pyrophosphate synthase [Heliophilum fasciatum]
MSWKKWEHLLPELSNVRAQLEATLRLKSGSYTSIMGANAFDEDKMYPAIVVLLIARMFGHTTRSMRYLASVVQCIHVATEIHRTIPDERAGTIRDGQTIPFAALVGDLLYARFFALLCEGEILSCLYPLSQSICAMHEGAMIRKELVETGYAQENHTEAMRTLEGTSLVVTACRLAGQAGNASFEESQALEQFGRAVGMLGAQRLTSLSTSQAAHWLAQGLDAIEQLPQGAANDACRLLLNNLGARWRSETPRSAVVVADVACVPCTSKWVV